MKSLSLLVGAGLAVVILIGPISTTTHAGPLAEDPNGMPGFTGFVSFDADGQLLVDLDFAVFEPGNYPDDLVGGDDPSDGTEYVYAYQAFNESASEPLTTVSVGLLDFSEAANAMGDPLHDLTGGVNPLSSLVQETSVLTLFIPQILADDFSSVFLFTSPFGPTYMPASVLNGGLSDQQMAPSPIPEPATLGLLALGAMAVVIRRR